MQSPVALERLLALLLALDETHPVSAPALAERLNVSLRTVYRDVARLQAAGVPVQGAPGRGGGLLLAPGYRLRPLGLTARETIALSLAVRTLQALPTLPYRAELDSAARKVAGAAAVRRPELLADLERWLRIEPPAPDTFHPERSAGPAEAARTSRAAQVFIDALLEGRTLRIDYHSPYRPQGEALLLDPAGVIVDRGLWYLVGFPAGSLRRARHLRADRVRGIEPGPRMKLARIPTWRPDRARPWLAEAMQSWTEASPVELEISAAQAARLTADWYFGLGRFTPEGPDRVRFTWGENEFERVRELVAWLGPPARLLAPQKWIAPLRQALLEHGRSQRSR